MATIPAPPRFRPRELRRRVILPARMRTAAGWKDACIRNVSSRGLLIRAAGLAQAGTMVELWHGEHVIVGRVVWSQGPKAGLCSEERVPVEEIMALSQSPALQLTAGSRPFGVERRKRPRDEESRVKGRMMAFASVSMIAASLALGMSAVVERAMAQPFAAVEAALVSAR